MQQLTLLLILATLQYGWVFWPGLGFWWGALNSVIILGIIAGTAIPQLPRKMQLAVVWLAIIGGVTFECNAARWFPSVRLQEAYRVESKQQADSAGKGQQNPSNNKHGVASGNQDNGNKAGHEAAHQVAESSEFWSVFGRTLKITDTFLALFTALLVVFTGLLWFSTEKLWADAKNHASVEQPILHITRIDADELKDPDFQWVKNLTPKITVRNYGRTPAFVREVLINVTICKFLPNEPIYERFTKYPSASVIDSRDSEDGRHKLVYSETHYTECRFTDEAIATLKEKGGQYLFVYGVIHFGDFMGNEHSKGFVSVWNWRHHYFMPCGQFDKNYDYQT